MNCRQCSAVFASSPALYSHLLAVHGLGTGRPPVTRLANAPTTPTRRRAARGRIPTAPSPLPLLPPAPLRARPATVPHVITQAGTGGQTTHQFWAYVVPLSGVFAALPASVTLLPLPGLGTTALIESVCVEYRGQLSTNMRWAAVISDTAPTPSDDIMEKMCAGGAIEHHDCKTGFFAAQVHGPPIQADPAVPRALYICLELGVSPATAGGYSLKVRADVAGAVDGPSDHVTL